MICKHCKQIIVEGYFNGEEQELNANVEPCTCEDSKGQLRDAKKVLADKTRCYLRGLND